MAGYLEEEVVPLAALGLAAQLVLQFADDVWIGDAFVCLRAGVCVVLLVVLKCVVLKRTVFRRTQTTLTSLAEARRINIFSAFVCAFCVVCVLKRAVLRGTQTTLTSLAEARRIYFFSVFICAFCVVCVLLK